MPCDRPKSSLRNLTLLIPSRTFVLHYHHQQRLFSETCLFLPATSLLSHQSVLELGTTKTSGMSSEACPQKASTRKVQACPHQFLPYLLLLENLGPSSHLYPGGVGGGEGEGQGGPGSVNAPNSSKHFSDPWRWWKHHPSFWKPEPQASRDFFLYLQLPHFNKICVFLFFPPASAPPPQGRGGFIL